MQNLIMAHTKDGEGWRCNYIILQVTKPTFTFVDSSSKSIVKLLHTKEEYTSEKGVFLPPPPPPPPPPH